MHAPYFTEIEIDRPEDLGGGIWKITGLNTITAIFGKNGSGKSRLLRAWRDKNPTLTHYVIPERTGEMTFEPGYLQNQISASGRKSTAENNFIDSYRRHVVTRIQAYFLTRGSVRENQLPGDPEQLEKLISTVLPDFLITLKGTENPPYELYRTSTNAKVENVSQLSSGEAQVLTVSLDCLTVAAIWMIQGVEHGLLLIDEPDERCEKLLGLRML